ncbi:Gfo/Idh/MocA family oxidoreductase [Halorubrum sp. AD140]|uniref:Gfo/Idh/MocA family oxidoreductase n=1 Tax=Halorubrum sp. AD140 TaxID=3050073 RepID=UPI002ACCA06A|nr:Gfo/Idh/MocA family oxidoreductase [Halorubrum sp. AD140]MDZ5810237.1 Gfo/Idh/MocA family oxidoreductase [Halorubrum sp. AD140]
MTVPVGVLGVGSMGRHHARVYQEIADADLVGVADVDRETATEVAEAYDTRVLPPEELFEAADAVSIAVPSQYHHDAGMNALNAGVHALIEKPLASTTDEAEALVSAAERAGVTLQVGHIERFNPAVRAVAAFADDLDLIAVDARRLGPPLDGGRGVDDGVVLDLMIHDLDIVRSLVGAPVDHVTAAGSPDGQYVTATLDFETDVVGSLTASRVTQRKVRELTLTAVDCQVTVDYIDRSVRIHRRTRPEFLVNDGDLRYRSEQVVERPTVDNGEPLKKELSAFLEAVETGSEPVVSGPDGVEALSLAHRVQSALGSAAVSERERPSM